MRDFDHDNELLASYGLPTIEGAELWEGFSVGGCNQAYGPSIADGGPITDAGSVGMEWGESAWGDKRDRKRTMVRRRKRRNLTASDRAALVAYRRQLVETTGRATIIVLDDCESMVTIEKTWREILDNRP